jgi:hypothetical protein
VRYHHRAGGADGSASVEQPTVGSLCFRRLVSIATRQLTVARYGVTRVYAQQCGYVLTDAEAARAGMRAVFKALKADALDAVGGHKGRSVLAQYGALHSAKLTRSTVPTNLSSRTIRTSYLS